MNTASEGAKTYTKVTSPESCMSANSITGVDMSGEPTASALPGEPTYRVLYDRPYFNIRREGWQAS